MTAGAGHPAATGSLRAVRSSLVLVVDDEAAYLRLAREVLAGIESVEAEFMDSGEAALAWVEARAGSPDAPLPALILLDWRMPGLCGRELLGIIRMDRRLASIRMVVLSSSDAPDDIACAIALGADGWLCKPSDLRGYCIGVETACRHWTGRIGGDHPAG